MFNLWQKSRDKTVKKEEQTQTNKPKNDFNSAMQNMLDPYAPIKQYAQKLKKSFKFALLGGVAVFIATSMLFSFLAIIKENHIMFLSCSNGVELTKIDSAFAISIPQLGLSNKKSNCIVHDKKTLVCGPYNSPGNSLITYYYIFQKNLTGYIIPKILIKLNNTDTTIQSLCEGNNLQYDKLNNACVYSFEPPINCHVQHGLQK